MRRRQRKTTVEECIAFSLSSIRRQMVDGAKMQLSWPSKPAFKLYVEVHWRQALPSLSIEYHGSLGRYRPLGPIEFTDTRTPYGRRLWFLCPFRRSDGTCRRRIRKLYLPPGENFFGCRWCHDLTFRSCQTAHMQERLNKKLGIE
jgi:hypothetical protein